jgi:hypothetical protein
VKTVIIYGSRAKGTYTNGSDVNLTIIGDTVDMPVSSTGSKPLSMICCCRGHLTCQSFPRSKNQDLVAHIKRVGIVFHP